MTNKTVTDNWGYCAKEMVEAKPEPFDVANLASVYSKSYQVWFYGRTEEEAQSRMDAHEAIARDRLATTVYFNGSGC